MMPSDFKNAGTGRKPLGKVKTSGQDESDTPGVDRNTTHGWFDSFLPKSRCGTYLRTPISG